MNIFGLKLDLFIHLAAVISTGTALLDPYARSYYAPKAAPAHLPRDSYHYEVAEPSPSTTEASQTFKIEVDVPQLIRSYLGLPDAQARSDGKPVNSQKFQLELKTPDFSKMWESFRHILRESTNRRIDGAYVEEGPGLYKSETVVYPKNFHRDSLLKLMKLKEKKQLGYMASPMKTRRGWADDDKQLEFLW